MGTTRRRCPSVPEPVPPGTPWFACRCDPGEGFWWPAQGIVFDGYTIDQTGIAVMLVLQARE